MKRYNYIFRHKPVFYSNDTLYRYMNDDENSNYYETIYTIFTLGKGDKYTTYMNSTEYVI